MSNHHHHNSHLEKDSPPIFSTWNQLYVFVLVFHAVIIALFYLFTKAFS